jgi:nitrogen fixation NifU-like protein
VIVIIGSKYGKAPIYPNNWIRFKNLNTVIMVNKSTDFWQRHSLNFLNMAFGDNKNETIVNPDGYAKQVNRCGDSVEFFIVGSPEHLDYVSYQVNGCLNLETCANTVAHMTCGRSAIQAGHITSGQVVTFLESLPVHEKHCAELAVQAFREALQDFITKTTR